MGIKKQKIIIIGAGIAGLTAGCYAEMNGYDVEIYEKHHLPGGLCTSWVRNGFKFDGCIHWLAGISPGINLYEYWSEVGAIMDRRMFIHEAYCNCICKNGQEITYYSDVDQLSESLIRLSGEDRSIINEFCRLIRQFSRLSIIDGSYIMGGTDEVMKRDFIFCANTSIEDFAKGFKSTVIRESFHGLGLLFPQSSLFYLILAMCNHNNKTAGFPEGGSLAFAQAIERRFTDLGGKIFYQKEVSRVLIENKMAKGIELRDGGMVYADRVISAADLNFTLKNLLENKYMHPKFEYLFQKVQTFSSGIQVSLGLKQDFLAGIDSDGIRIHMSSHLKIGNKENEWLIVKNYGYDRTLAPEGKSIVSLLLINVDFNYWMELYKDREAYRNKKNEIADQLIAIVDQKYHGFRDAIEVVDIATPVTYFRYTGNYEGNFMSWVMEPINISKIQNLPQCLPEVEHLYFTGMWLMAPGGLPSAIKTSRALIGKICDEDGKVFKAVKPSYNKNF